jgi:hypothetical protein
MSIRALKLTAARQSTIELPPGAARDLRDALRFNARQAHGSRITQDAFRAHLKTTYGVSIGHSTLQRLARDLGKRWSGEDVG